MADTKTDSSSTPLSDDPANPTKGLSAKPNTASHPAGAEPALDTLFHRTLSALRAGPALCPTFPMDRSSAEPLSLASPIAR